MGSVPKIEAQLGNLQLIILLDSGSMRSLISFDQFQGMGRGGPQTSIIEDRGDMCRGIWTKLGDCR
jgi:hypothetical protein